jgi:hypothetical protein
MTEVERLERLGELGLVVSICYGPCGDSGASYSVDVLHRIQGADVSFLYETFDAPYSAESFGQCLDIAEKESVERGWIKRDDIGNCAT